MFEGDRRILPMCVISALAAKKLLHKDSEAYLVHIIDTSTPKVTLENVPIVRELSNIFLEDLLIDLTTDRSIPVSDQN